MAIFVTVQGSSLLNSTDLWHYFEPSR